MMPEPFDSQELMELLRGLEQRGIPCTIEHRRVTGDCDGIVVRISAASRIWEMGFYDNNHIEVLKYALTGNAQTGVTAASILSDWDSC
jgi:Fe2+ transport system protein FeoA